MTQEGARLLEVQGVDWVLVKSSTFMLGVKAMTLGQPLEGFVETGVALTFDVVVVATEEVVTVAVVTFDGGGAEET